MRRMLVREADGRVHVVSKAETYITTTACGEMLLTVFHGRQFSEIVDVPPTCLWCVAGRQCESAWATRVTNSGTEISFVEDGIP